MSEPKVGGWVKFDDTWSKALPNGSHARVRPGWWIIFGPNGMVITKGPETGALGKAHADAALCEHGLTPWPCAACGGKCDRNEGRYPTRWLHPIAPDEDRMVPVCNVCPSRSALSTSIAARALYADGTPLLAAWLRASAPKVAPKPCEIIDPPYRKASGALVPKPPPPAPRCPAGHDITTPDAPCAVCHAEQLAREEQAADDRAAAEALRLQEQHRRDAARRARLANPVVRADLASLPTALRACADEVERSPLAMMPILTSRAVAARLRALAVEVASRQEQDGYVWAGWHYVSDRSYPHERLGLVYAHRIAPSDYVALQLASWAADIPAPADPWAGWERTSATDAAKRGAR